MSKSRSFASLVLLAACLASRSLGAQPARPITVSNPVLSPDGQWVAYTHGRAFVDPLALYVVATQPGAAPQRVAVGIAPAWSRDSRQLAFQALDSTRQFQIFIWDRGQGSVKQLTRIPEGINPSFYVNVFGGTEGSRLDWSPDGRRILFASRIPSSTVPIVSDTTPIVITGDTPPARVWAGILNRTFSGWRYVEGKAEGTMVPASVGLRLPDESVQLFAADVGSGVVAQLTRERAGAFDAAWSADGKSIVFESNEDVPMIASRLRATNLYRSDADGSRRVALTTGPDRKYFPVWSSDGRSVAFQRQPDGVYGSVGTALVDVVTRVVTLDSATVASALAQGFAIGDRRDVIAVVDRSRVELRLPGTSARALVDVSEPTPANRGTGSAAATGNAQQPFQWTGARGAPMTGRLQYPANYQPGRRYPLIVDPYNEWQTRDTLTNAGYLLFSPGSIRTPHSPGDAKHSAAYRALVVDSPTVALRVTLDDVMSGVDTLIRRGLVDSTRMALTGFSNGGGAVNYLITMTSRFKCAVAQSPAAGDMMSTFFTDPDGEYLLTFFNGVAPWDKPGLYALLSPVSYLNRVHTPVLYAVGDNESFAFISSALEMYDGLRRLRRPATVVRYPGQGHGLTGWALTDWAVRARKFLDDCLGKGAPGP